MEIYVEYAFVENFIFDAALLWLSLTAAKASYSRNSVFFSAALGAGFAIVYPLLRLPLPLAYLLKITVGFLLCATATTRLKTKKDMGRYAFTVAFFFGFSFAFGGALTGLLGDFFPKKIPVGVVAAGFAILCAASLVFIRRLQQRKAVTQFLCDCRLRYGGAAVTAVGFLDSGNLAQKDGLPVCFISPDLFYELCGEIVLQGKAADGQMEIRTLGGVKKLALYLGEMEFFSTKQEPKRKVYFSVSSNIVSREYKIIVNARLAADALDKE